MFHQFSVEAFYTAGEIASTVGGDVTSPFPMARGQTVALRLRHDVHRDAPRRVHVDAGAVHLHGIEAWMASGEAIPVFLKDPRRTLYAYQGLFRCVGMDRDPQLLKAESERIGRRATAIILLQRSA